ncbi:MAG: TlpA family protein disulfide reductase [Acidobacteria bacterium]|nr:TlpA family protein disulfide reductase [Acidobacteriota bacterium]
MNRWKKWALPVIILLAGVSLNGCGAGGGRAQTSASMPAAAAAEPGGASSVAKVGTAVGESAPDFQLTQLDGAQVSPQELRGRPAVLVFWTAWCPSCKEEAPHINELAAKYEPQGVRVVGINIQDSPARLAGGIKDFGIKYPVASDADASVARRYKVVGTPTIVFLDEQGIVQYFGNELPKDYAARLDALLAKA